MLTKQEAFELFLLSQNLMAFGLKAFVKDQIADLEGQKTMTQVASKKQPVEQETYKDLILNSDLINQLKDVGYKVLNVVKDKKETFTSQPLNSSINVILKSPDNTISINFKLSGKGYMLSMLKSFTPKIVESFKPDIYLDLTKEQVEFHLDLMKDKLIERNVLYSSSSEKDTKKDIVGKTADDLKAYIIKKYEESVKNHKDYQVDEISVFKKFKEPVEGIIFKVKSKLDVFRLLYNADNRKVSIKDSSNPDYKFDIDYMNKDQFVYTLPQDMTFLDLNNAIGAFADLIAVNEQAKSKQKSSKKDKKRIKENVYSKYITENITEKMSLPPPPSPLLKAYYGSNAYESNSPPHEIPLDKINKTQKNPPSCPQITGGSNPKSVHYNPYNNQCILIKTQKVGQATMEVLASQIHRSLGMYAPDMRSFGTKLFSPLIDPNYQQATTTEIEHIIKFKGDKFDDLKQQIVDLYIISCWIANWDVWGLGGDNTLISKKGDKSTLACIDLGGAFMYSAMGGIKDEKGWKPLWFENEFLNVVKRMNSQMLDMLNEKYSAGKYFNDLAYGESANQGIFNKGSKLNKMANNTCTRALMLFYPNYNYIRSILNYLQVENTKALQDYFKNTPNNSSTFYYKEHTVDLMHDWLFHRILAIKSILNE